MSDKNIESRNIEWEKVKEDILLKHLIRDERDFQIDIMKLESNRQYPSHIHSWKEYIYVLKGSMSDESGEYVVGDLIVNYRGSRHSVKSGVKGCEFLVIWDGNLLPED